VYGVSGTEAQIAFHLNNGTTGETTTNVTRPYVTTNWVTFLVTSTPGSNVTFNMTFSDTSISSTSDTIQTNLPSGTNASGGTSFSVAKTAGTRSSVLQLDHFTQRGVLRERLIGG
jgi:hypothetical protein